MTNNTICVEFTISYIRPRPSSRLLLSKVVTMRYALYVVPVSCGFKTWLMLSALAMNQLSSFWINQVRSACFICLTFFYTTRRPVRFSMLLVDTGFPVDSGFNR